jgi:hypothetical protein
VSDVPDTVGTRHDTVELVSVYRRLLTWLGIGTALGACAELAMLRHWQGPGQLVPWAVLAVLGGAFGVYEHVGANLAAGPLSGRYAADWESMPAVSQLWAAATGAVGTSPVLAPGMVGLAGALLWLGALRWRPGSP